MLYAAMAGAEVLELAMRGGARAVNSSHKGMNINVNPLMLAMVTADATKDVSELANLGWDAVVNRDPDGFSKMGSHAATVMADTGMIGLTAWQAVRDTATMGAEEVTVKGFIKPRFYKQDGEFLKQISRKGDLELARMKLGSAEAKNILKTGGKRYLTKGGRSILRQGFGWDIKATFGIMGLGILGSMALGAIGSIMDEAHKDSMNFRKIQYDTRYFDTRQADMSSYHQIGAAMQNYSSRMQSVARIYHAR